MFQTLEDLRDYSSKQAVCTLSPAPRLFSTPFLLYSFNDKGVRRSNMTSERDAMNNSSEINLFWHYNPCTSHCSDFL